MVETSNKMYSSIIVTEFMKSDVKFLKWKESTRIKHLSKSWDGDQWKEVENLLKCESEWYNFIFFRLNVNINIDYFNSDVEKRYEGNNKS